MENITATQLFMREVSSVYQQTASLQRTAEKLDISYAKVRKILITLGEYETDFSVEVGKRREMGRSIAEIASELNTSANRVAAFLPYEKNLYLGPEQTKDSKKSQLYRERIETAREKFVIQPANIAEVAYLCEEKGELMMNESKFKTGKEKRVISAIRLHLELKDDHLREDDKRILRRYGESSTGNVISRDILIPSDMPLHHLHYTIQRLFGWQNSHLRRFILPEETYQALTGGTVKGWADLVGTLFQPPGESEDDLFWDDDYRSGSIKTWLKKKYTGPYVFRGVMEDHKRAQADVMQLMERSSVLEVKESFSEYYSRYKETGEQEMRVLKRAPLIACTLEEMKNSINFESGTEDLLERLEVAKVLAFRDEAIDSDASLFPVADQLIYQYDFGDNWTVTITKERDSTDLLQNGYVSRTELEEAESEVLTRHKPVCIHRDGVFVVDDVGGLHGFVRFLEGIYEGDDEVERRSSITWAKNLGWSERKISNKLIL